MNIENETNYKITTICEFNGITIGISYDNEWYLIKSSFVKKANENTLIGLPLLEGSYNEFIVCLQEGIKKAGKKRSLMDNFPIEIIVLAALKSDSSHWNGRALEWLDHLKNINIYEDSLKAISIAKSSSQKNKHKATKLLNRV
ncbi:MAG: hypothetical protein ACOYMA_02045 [Bacteroidia bacterium]